MPNATATPAEVLHIGDTDVHVDGHGPETIIMVHGFPDTHRLWDGTVDALKDRYRCARFTLPGFTGGARREGYALREVVDLIGAVANRVSPDQPVILMAHDWGCLFAYQFYVRHPDRVSRVVGVDIGDPHSLRREIGPRALALLLAYQWTLALAWKVRGRLGDAITRFVRKGMRCPSDPAPVSSAMTWPYYMTWFGGYRGQIRAFEPQCPTLFVYARRKPFMFHARAWVERLRARPGSEVHGFDTGHWIMLQDPAGFHALVRRWLGEPVAG